MAWRRVLAILIIGGLIAAAAVAGAALSGPRAARPATVTLCHREADGRTTRLAVSPAEAKTRIEDGEYRQAGDALYDPATMRPDCTRIVSTLPVTPIVNGTGV